MATKEIKTSRCQPEIVTSTDAMKKHRPTGPLVAATMAPVLGFFTLMLSHHISRLSASLDQLVHAYGHWIPGSLGSGPDGSIGSYAGKETLALVVWFVSWGIFHYFWREQDLSIATWIPWFLGTLSLIILGFFHPIIDPVVLFLAGSLGLV